jgi:transposase
MSDIQMALDRWHMDVTAVREQMYRAPSVRERERWHAVWLLAQGWSAAEVGRALERDAHTISEWAKQLRLQGPTALAFEQSGGAPPPSTQRNRRS